MPALTCESEELWIDPSPCIDYDLRPFVGLHPHGIRVFLFTVIVLLESTLSAAARDQTTALLGEWCSANVFEIGGAGSGWGDCLKLTALSPEAMPEAAASAQLEQLQGVEAVLTDDKPLHHVAHRAESSQIALSTELAGPSAALFGAGAFSVIAGPCSVENYQGLLTVAKQVRAAGATALRGGAFKPRTSPYSFQGLGESGLEMMAAARAETGLALITEVMDTRQVALVADYADALQIGSRNMMNYSLLKEAGAAGKVVMLKRGMSATLSEFLFAAEYLAHAGCQQILLCERGLRHFDPAVRNLLDLSAVPALQQRTHLPVVVDPSHGTCDASLVAPMMAASAAVGADGLMVEVHPRPARSVSDAGQALSPSEFTSAMTSTSAVLSSIGKNLHQPLAASLSL